MTPLLLIILLLILAGGLYYVLFAGASPGGCCSPSAPPSCSAAPSGLYYVSTWLPSSAPRVLDEFFTRASLGGPHPYGLDRDGVLVQQARDADARVVVVRDDSLNSPEALARWPLTYACGHAFYDSRPAFGRLRGSSWAQHVAATARVRVDAAKLSPDSVLLLEGEAGGDGPSLVACVTGDLTAMGVVVRRNAALLVNDVDALWKLQFILVESGGLLQAGSNCRDSHRFHSRLRVQLVHPPGGYAAMPVVASQYSYRVYAPGVDFAKGQFEAFDGSGMCFTNGFGAKCVCVGFNGNLHLAGAATAPVPYLGTWKASDPGGRDWLNGPEQTGGDGLFTYGSSLLPASYACVWARLRQGSGRKGERALQLHRDDLPPLAELRRAWPPGSLLLVTCSSQQFTTASNPTGLLPFRFPDGAGTSMDADNSALAARLQVGDRGVEVVTLDGVDADGALRLREPLAFDHSLQWVQLSNDKHATTKSISVQVHHHVGLLSRNITIEGVASSGGAGCNVQAAPSSTMASTMASGVENSGPGAPPGGAIAGSGGAVDVNYYNSAQGDAEITTSCYGARTPERWREFYGVKGARPSQDLKGSWLMGTAGLTGCNSLLGGHCMFRNGSSVLLDAVELVRMGLAPNFGKLGQYALHFHLAGFVEAFRGYLRDRAHPRDGLVQNCSIWRSYSRFVTLHGACGVTVRNNVCFLGYGHGFFVEDGTELANVFDHNLSAASLVCASNAYWNPSGIYGNVATDYCPVGMVWLKNNMNVVARSVFCCSPGNTIALWYVPQPISRLRGPSAVTFGSQELQLPHCGSLEAITTTGLSSQGKGNTNFRKVAPSATTMVCRDLSSENAAVNCSCWRPADRGLLDFAYTDLRTGCSSYTSDNALHPLQLCAENVGYCLAGFWSEFPEELSDRMQNNDPKDGTFAKYPPGMAINCGLELQDGKPATMWLPTDGQNSCTDTIVSTYPPTRWVGPWNRGPAEDAFTAYLPMTAETLTKAVDDCETAQADGVFATPLPKILAACLTFNLGANGALWGGSGWMKGSPGMLLNCALLETSFRTAGQADAPMTEMHPDGSPPATQPSYTSTSFNIAYQDTINLFAQWYVVIHNHLTNGVFPFQTNPTVLSGGRTYADTKFSYAWSPNEYSHDPTGVVVALPNVFVFDLDFPTVLQDVVEQSKNTSVVVASPLQVFDATNMQSYSVVKGQPNSRKELGPWTFPVGGPWPGSPVKFPFLCGGSQDDYGLLRTRSADTREGERPEWGGLVANALLRSFTAPQAVALGDLVCKNLARTWKNVPPLAPTTAPPSGGWKTAAPLEIDQKETPACSAPPPFRSPASAP